MPRLTESEGDDTRPYIMGDGVDIYSLAGPPIRHTYYPREPSRKRTNAEDFEL